MKKLYLTIGISSKHLRFEFLSNFYKIDAGEFLSSLITKDNFDKINLIEELPVLLTNYNQDILIGFAIKTQKEYQSLKKELLNTKFSIIKVFIKSSANYTDYKKKHDQLSNWMDYHPDFVKEQDRKQNEELKALAKVLHSDGIEVEFIE